MGGDDDGHGPAGPVRAGHYLELAQAIDRGNRPLFELASCFSELRVDPRLGMTPGTEMFYRAMSEMVYSRYGLRGTVKRALRGEHPRSLHDSLVLCAMNVDRMAEQAGWLLNLMRQGGGPEALPIVSRMEDLFRQERANFQVVTRMMEAIMGADAPAARARVMRSLAAVPVTGSAGF